MKERRKEKRSERKKEGREERKETKSRIMYGRLSMGFYGLLAANRYLCHN